MSRIHLEHWAKVQEQHTSVHEFLTWLHYQYGIELDWDRAKPGTPLNIRKLVDEFFEVDQVGLEKERRELLDSLAKQSVSSPPLGMTEE